MEKKYGNTPYSTKVTNLGDKIGCRIFKDGKIVSECVVESKMEITQAFRDMFRWIDKGGGDKFTNEVRHRNHWKRDKIHEIETLHKVQDMPLEEIPLVINDYYVKSDRKSVV